MEESVDDAINDVSLKWDFHAVEKENAVLSKAFLL